VNQFEQDWTLLNAAVNELQDYLLSADLYWPIAGMGTVGKLSLTPGALLISLKRINSLTMASSRREEFASMTSRVVEIRKRWRSNWLEKAEKDYSVRLNLWKKFLLDLSQDLPAHSNDYPHQVNLRTMIYLLGRDLGTADHDEDLQDLDQKLRSISQPGPFVWESDLESGFSAKEYWFLFLSFNLKDRS
jgi:hypothetical protein